MYEIIITSLCFFNKDWTLASSRPTSSEDTNLKVSNIHMSTSSASANHYLKIT